MIKSDLIHLKESLKGDINTDILYRTMYATDASVYKELPLAVAYPKDEADLRGLIDFAHKHNTSLIPRTAGTSLAGQVVGGGIVVDVSRYLTKIIEINPEKKYVWVEPGVVLEELNQKLSEYGLFFGPETSTANRCMIGGMLGNNACGLHSLVYGSTRDHTLAVKGLLSDGSSATFEDISPELLKKKLKLESFEGRIYRSLVDLLSPISIQKEIRAQYPDPEIPRRNTGYAIDLLLDMHPFKEDGFPLNLCKILGGSEGTLVFSTQIKLNLVPLPPLHKAVICAHFTEIQETLQANLIALKNHPTAVELMDSTVLNCTKSNKLQEENRFFVEGDPRTILIIEFAENSTKELDYKINKTVKDLNDSGNGYAFPVIYGDEIEKVWNLRKAGLGLLSNIPGDAKSVTVIEDTAVHVEQLPAYIADIEQVFERNNMECVYHAHIGTGELHMRPVLNLKLEEDVKKFRMIAEETVKIIKKYRGSFSGEHGDGRLRGSFIPDLFGEIVYGLLKEVKKTFDPEVIFNPGKIVDSPPMDEFLRYEPGQETPQIDTYFDFSATDGFLRAIEKCNGSGDCRKSHLIGGSMCPSYQATRDEKNTTRARANILREFITKGSSEGNPFDHQEIYEVLDLCLSCKACKTECPSSIDMARLKAEFLSHWYENHGVPFRTKLIAEISSINKLGSFMPGFTNFILKNSISSGILKRLAGFGSQRSFPTLSGKPLHKTAPGKLMKINPSRSEAKSSVCLFIDEFTDYNDGDIGLKAIELLTSLGYRVILPAHNLSARTYLSKGLLKKAKAIINDNIRLLTDVVSEDIPLVGIEPSAILGFRDEFPELADPHLKEQALTISKHSFLIDEFLWTEAQAGRITSTSFSKENCIIKLHGHCQQKAVASTDSTIGILSLPENYSVTEIPSGCCGMAGSFGYEKEHYDLSMQVGELILFPAVRSSDQDTIICAPGTSCRHQIKDGTGRTAYHTIEILHSALANNN
ncbi:MAG: FAD-linked oxidase C-terminal domain-containing protein [Bacteroidota bacterium]|nr:FAD-linked oxidase C-terminal domain-containing protein [Bacteroidota bacterium]